jgi:hypothetical protein
MRGEGRGHTIVIAEVAPVNIGFSSSLIPHPSPKDEREAPRFIGGEFQLSLEIEVNIG